MSDELRILHQIVLRNGAWGGMEKHFAAFVRDGQKRSGVSNFLVENLRRVAPEVGAALACLSQPARELRRWHGLPVPKWPVAARQVHRASLARRWDINCVLNWNLFGDTAPARLAERRRGLSVYWERGAAWYESAPDFDPAFIDAYGLYLANSEASRQMLLQRWGVRGEVQVCAPGVVFGGAPGAMARTRSQGRAVRLGFAARLRGFKGGVLAVHAIAELARRGIDAELWVAGEGKDGTRMSAEALRLGIADRVRMLGRVSPMEPFLDSIDLLLHPALREPYGLACAEALAAGAPVVATAVDGLGEVVEHGVTGLCVEPTLPLSRYAEFGGDAGDVYPMVYRPQSGTIGEPMLPDPAALADAVAIIMDADRYTAMSTAALQAHRGRLAFERKQEHLYELLRAALGKVAA